MDLALIRPDGSEVPEENEDVTVGVVPVNIDDDDNDGGDGGHGRPIVKPDMDDSDGTSNEDDLIRIGIHKIASIPANELQSFVFTLSFDTMRFSLYQNADRTNRIKPSQAGKDATTLNPGADTVLYVEGKAPTVGVSGSEITLALSRKKGNDELDPFAFDTVKVVVPEMIFAIFGDGPGSGPPFAEEVKLREYLSPLKLDERENPYIIMRPAKCFSVRICTTEKEAKIAMGSRDSYISYDGHSNFGLGYAFERGLERISQFMNCSQDLVRIQWEYLRDYQYQPLGGVEEDGSLVSDDEYGDDVTTEDVPWDPVKYNGTYKGAHNEYTAEWDSDHPVQGGVHLHLERGTHKYQDIFVPGNDIIVKSAQKDMPPKAWKKILLHSCFSGDYYSPVFNHGTLFFTTWTSHPLGSIREFVRSVIEGRSDDQTIDALDAIEDGLFDYHQF